jgi:hypothetical protein
LGLAFFKQSSYYMPGPGCRHALQTLIAENMDPVHFCQTRTVCPYCACQIGRNSVLLAQWALSCIASLKRGSYVWSPNRAQLSYSGCLIGSLCPIGLSHEGFAVPTAQAVNTKCQGSAADLVKEVMVALHAALRKAELCGELPHGACRMLLQVRQADRQVDGRLEGLTDGRRMDGRTERYKQRKEGRMGGPTERTYICWHTDWRQWIGGQSEAPRHSTPGIAIGINRSGIELREGAVRCAPPFCSSPSAGSASESFPTAVGKALCTVVSMVDAKSRLMCLRP